MFRVRGIRVDVANQSSSEQTFIVQGPFQRVFNFFSGKFYFFGKS